MKRALISVSDKSGLTDLAFGLIERGYEIISTGGTAIALINSHLPARPVSSVTGFPEIMDGRVKTLHPKIHAGILARRDNPAHMDALKEHSIVPIDIVVVNLYQFAKAAAKQDITFDALIEEIDIGGPSMVRAAAKNFQDVLIVVDPADYWTILDELDKPQGPSLYFRFKLAQKAFAHTAAYDAKISEVLQKWATMMFV